jgi:hypothetical protein
MSNDQIERFGFRLGWRRRRVRDKYQVATIFIHVDDLSGSSVALGLLIANDLTTI